MREAGGRGKRERKAGEGVCVGTDERIFFGEKKEGKREGGGGGDE